MRPGTAITRAIELALIAALAGIGANSFSASGVYQAARDYGQTHNIAILPHLPVIIWGLLTLIGLLNIVLANRGSGFFTCLVMIFSLPSLLAHNTVDWAGILGWEIKLTTGLGFSTTLSLGALTITGYIILSFLRQFKQTTHSMTERRFNPADIESVSSFSHLSLGIAVLSAIGATALVGFLARMLEQAALNYIRQLPWNTVFIGLACLLIIAFYIYWLFSQRRKKAGGTGEEKPD